MKREIKLGDKVRDINTGFTGIAIAKTEFQNGCVQFCVSPPCGKDKSKMPEPVDLDIEQLEVVGKPKKKVISSPHGGPMNKKMQNRS